MVCSSTTFLRCLSSSCQMRCSESVFVLFLCVISGVSMLFVVCSVKLSLVLFGDARCLVPGCMRIIPEGIALCYVRE